MDHVAPVNVMSSADDYESLGASTPLAVSALAGATAGVAEHCLMFPLDTVKTRMQSLLCEKQHRNSIVNMLKTMIRDESAARPWKGVSAMVVGAGPAHAMYFTALEKTRETLQGSRLAEPLAAVGATLLHDAVMTPAEVVKQRMQMCCSPYSSAASAAIGIFRSEGPRAFYRSYATQLTMNVPFQMAVVTSYAACQSALNPEREYNPHVHLVSGALAGAVGSAVTMPLDVCKTLLNTQEAAVLHRLKRSKVTGLLGAASVVWRVSGVAGFFQGLSARVAYQAPSTAISWFVYESFKFVLKDKYAAVDDDLTLEELRKSSTFRVVAQTSE